MANEDLIMAEENLENVPMLKLDLRRAPRLFLFALPNLNLRYYCRSFQAPRR